MLFNFCPRATSIARKPLWRLPWRAVACLLLPCAFATASDALPAAIRSAWQSHPGAEAVEHTLAAARLRSAAAAMPLYTPELEFAFDHDGDDRTSTAGIALTLDLSGKRRAREAAGEAEYELVAAQAQARRDAFALDWLHAWAERGSAQKRLRLGAQRIALVQRFAVLAERQHEVGDISALERDLALLARDQAVAEQAMLIADSASADEAFRVVGGESDQQPVAEDDDLPPALTDHANGDREAPEQRIAQAQTLRAERLRIVAERDRRIDPTLSLRAGRIDFGPASDNVIGLGISLPLFAGQRLRAEADAAQAVAAAADAEQRLVAVQIDARIERTRRTYVAIRAARIAWIRSKGSDVQAHASLLERLWRAGEISTADYLVQLQQTLDTARAGAELHGRLWRAYADVMHASGELDAWVNFDDSVTGVKP